MTTKRRYVAYINGYEIDAGTRKSYLINVLREHRRTFGDVIAIARDLGPQAGKDRIVYEDRPIRDMQVIDMTDADTGNEFTVWLWEAK